MNEEHDKTFGQAAAEALTRKNTSPENRQALLDVMRVGAIVGGYYAGLISATVPDDMAREMAMDLHERFIENFMAGAQGALAVMKKVSDG